MPDDRRTPILSADGQTYCSPGCGRQCRKEWFDHATKRANELAAAIPNSTFAEITPKARDSAKHFAELHEQISFFLHSHSKARSLIPS